MRDRTRHYVRPFGSIADQLKRFNEDRLKEFGAAPLPDKRLPMAFTGVGGDIAPNVEED